MRNKIVVTGATGNVGQPLVQALVSAGEQVTAVSRRASDVPGARVHQADLATPRSLAPVLDDAKVVFVLTSGDFVGAGGDLTEVMSVVRDGGVERVVLLSSQGVGTGHHASDLEDAVRASGLTWTMLRPGGFHSNTLQWSETIRTSRVAEAPFGDVALPTIDPADIAEVAAVVLRDPSHVGESYELTGPTPISPRAQVEAIAAAVGEPIRFVPQTRAAAKTTMLRYMPEVIAESTLNILSASSPALQRVSPHVEQLLGRPARPFPDWATDNAAAFK